MTTYKLSFEPIKHHQENTLTTVEEVGVVVVGNLVDNRAVKITRRDSTVYMISDLHCSYDSLQYPLTFWLIFFSRKMKDLLVPM